MPARVRDGVPEVHEVGELLDLVGAGNGGTRPRTTRTRPFRTERTNSSRARFERKKTSATKARNRPKNISPIGYAARRPALPRSQFPVKASVGRM